MEKKLNKEEFAGLASRRSIIGQKMTELHYLKRETKLYEGELLKKYECEVGKQHKIESDGSIVVV